MASTTSFSLGRELKKDYPVIKRGEGNILFTEDGREVFDGSGGAAVSCLGHRDMRVIEAVYAQMCSGTSYVATTFWANRISEELCKVLIEGTEGKMAKAYLTGSGSEAMEAALKMSRQYFYEKDKNTGRVNYIAREGSYHGNTLGALAISGHRARREPYEPFLMKNVHRVSACYPYRQRNNGETDADFVGRKAAELEKKFQELGPETVIGFIAEPVVGAALGCVPSVPGYLKAMRDVCHKHGALFILDEVMCGMGRTGTLHAWQAEDVSPDIQTLGKALGGGYQPVAAMLISKKVADVLVKGTGLFIHGQTYQSMPVQAAAALEVQRIVKKDNLLKNVQEQGGILENRLKNALTNHPHVGDIRGQGLFWGIEFVKNKITKEPFDRKYQLAERIQDCALSTHNITIYMGTGTVDGQKGDHIILAPPYCISEKDVNFIVDKVQKVLEDTFNKLKAEGVELDIDLCASV